MTFRITGIDPSPFRPLFGLSDAELHRKGVIRYTADSNPGFPDRVEMRELEIGETALLLNYTHQPANSPYRSMHAIFVREFATAAYDEIGVIPEVLCLRPISLRAFDRDDMIIDAGIAEGNATVEAEVARLLDNPNAAYIHAHNAARGCYAGLIRRA